jgi:hypothetical protein
MSAEAAGKKRVATAIRGLRQASDGTAEGRGVSAAPQGGAPRRLPRPQVHVSTVLLVLALLGMVLRLTPAAAWLLKTAQPAGLMLAVLAPVWALCGCLAASVYLMLSMARPYNVVQLLVEMALGVLLIVLMLPVF